MFGRLGVSRGELRYQLFQLLSKMISVHQHHSAPFDSKSKGLGMVKEIKEGKKRKKRKFGENITFDSTKL